MKFGVKGRGIAVVVGVAIYIFCTGTARLQARPQQQQRQPMAEEVFKNVVVLKGIPVDEFMDTMGMFSAATSLNCISCHTEESAGSWEKFADETPLKITARRMVLMMNNFNRNNFGGERKVTCFTCHNGNQKPRSGANLALQYREVDDDPNEVEVPPGGFVGAPNPDAVFNKYIEAVGGVQRVGAVTSVVAKGTYSGFDTEFMSVPIEIYARAPNQRAQIIHALFGDNVKVFDGNSGWQATADKPVPLITLTGGNLDGARIEAVASFPARVRDMATNWRVGSASIDGEEVQVVQGTSNKQNVNLYFNEAGLLVRLVRINDTIVGWVPTQIDFTDYRDVDGVKIPFKFTTTWTDNKTVTELSSVQLNVPIEAARFNRPAPAPPPKH
jgi:hypothetical protein